MAKRTTNEIEKDYKQIRKVVDTTPVTSIKDIAKSTNLSESEVKTSLSKHPRVKDKIMAQLEKNKKELKAKKKSKGKNNEAKKKAEQEAKLDALYAKKKTEQENLKKETKQDTGYDVGFVIDASITGIENLHDTLSKICATNAKLVLTSITIKELEKMQKFKDIAGNDARNILAMAAENHESFHTVLIDETLENPDECIIKYCANHKDNVILLTSDKTMALRARMYGIKTRYFKKNKNSTHSNVQPAVYTTSRTNTLVTAKRIGGKLFISDFNTDYRSILVISNGLEYTEGVCELKIGDDVYLATKKLEYLTFAHYHITSLAAENNCKLIYSKRIYDVTAIDDLPKAGYKSFMSDFKRRYDL